VLDRYQAAVERIQKAQKIVARFAREVIEFSSLPVAVIQYQVPGLRQQILALSSAVDCLEATIRNVQPDIDATKESL